MTSHPYQYRQPSPTFPLHNANGERPTCAFARHRSANDHATARPRHARCRRAGKRLIEHILAGGVRGLFILGTSGEAPGLSYRLRRELIERVCRQVNQRVPVLVGITDTSLVEAHQMAQHAADCGVSAVVSAPPYYFAASQEELVTFVEKLVAGLPLPLFLYNMPQMTKVQFTPETLRQVAHCWKRLSASRTVPAIWLISPRCCL